MLLVTLSSWKAAALVRATFSNQESGKTRLIRLRGVGFPISHHTHGPVRRLQPIASGI